MKFLSDHAQLTVFTEDFVAGGPKPFKFYNMWAQHDSFRSIVQRAWNTHFQGTPLFVLCKKLRAVKLALKVWNQEEFGPIHHKVAHAGEFLHQAQAQLADREKLWGFGVSLEGLVGFALRGRMEVLPPSASNGTVITTGRTTISVPPQGDPPTIRGRFPERGDKRTGRSRSRVSLVHRPWASLFGGGGGEGNCKVSGL
ncbi:hypothetical protein Taro_027799 [Colocasia esculenta]|uniref:Uncharacterized protein n=1 Tax=Colocasia esculenta TaxID=4460 RepID=A0A843VGQ9_COLES|nr:hypothetical protein [Colocasia esculenta]